MYPPQQFQQAYPQQQQQYSQQYSQQGQNDSAASEPTMDYYEWQRQQQEAEEKARAEAKKQEAIRWMAARFPSVDEKLREKFLVARKYEAVEASQMLEASLRWRRAYGCPVDPVPIAHQLALGTIFMAGRDYDGHPIVYHIGGGLPGTATEAQVALAARAAVFWMERATRYSPDGKVTVVVIRDAAFPGKPQPRGLGSLRYPRHLAKILEANFPESLAKAVIYPGDGWFSTIWRVASRFVDAETRNKIHLVGNKRDLLKYVPHDQLLAFLGGANFYRFDVNSIIPNFPQTRYLPGPPGSQPPPQQTPSPPRLPQQPAPWGGGPHQQQPAPSWGGGPHQQQPGPSWGGGPHQQQPGPWGSPPPPPPPRKTVHTSEALQHKNENSTPLNSSNRPKSSVLARAAMFEKRSSTTNNNVSSSRSKDAQSEIGQSGSLQDRKSAFENSLSSSTNLSQGRAEINKRTGSLRHLSAKFEASPQSQKSEQMTMARKEIAQLGSLQARIQKLQSSKTQIPLFSNGDMKNTCDDVATTTNSIARQEIAQLHHEQDRNENFENSRNTIAHLFQNGPARAPRTSKTLDDGSSTCSRGPIHQIGQPISGRGQKARGLGLGRTMPASRNKPQKVKTIKFVVIGSPGHGKSTCLNEIAQEDYFEMSAGGKSCTQAGGVWDKKNRSEIIVCDDEVEYHLTLIDTPGFPDPDASKAAHYYDYLVKKCSEPINGVLFVMKPERIIPDVLKRYKILMQQFVYLCVPMVVLVNGYFTRSRLDDDESFAIRKKNDIKDMRQTATRILAATGLHPREIFISWCLDDIADFGPDIAHAFSIDGAASSNLKTISQIQDEVKRCRDSIYAAEAERNRYNVQIGRIASDIESLYKTLDKYEAVKDSGIGYIPIIGWGISKYSAIKAAEKNARIHELEASKKTP
uniref:CRAL-TRIO domain-containing protein n=1 Tax=Aureoumbra lagunensis TaxID=44058 RepID=A0A7S3NKY8_9STRA